MPAYLMLSMRISAHDKQAAHRQRLAAMLEALGQHYYFRRRGGADHVFGYSSTNSGLATNVGVKDLSQVLNRAYFGTFGALFGVFERQKTSCNPHPHPSASSSSSSSSSPRHAVRDEPGNPYSIPT